MCPCKSQCQLPSGEEHEEQLRGHLEAEVREGLVEKMALQDFEEKCREDRAIAALAVLVEDEATGTTRVIHDGSQDIRVNHRIKCLDNSFACQEGGRRDTCLRASRVPEMWWCPL